MRRLKPAPDPWIDLPGPASGSHRAGKPAGRWLDGSTSAPTPAVARRRDPLDLVFVATWAILTLPFRLIFGLVNLIGRLTGLVVGFSLMVAGAALAAGPLAIVGVPLFVVGLLLAMRSLG